VSVYNKLVLRLHASINRNVLVVLIIIIKKFVDLIKGLRSIQPKFIYNMADVS
jgi:hypothetical protein